MKKDADLLHTSSDWRRPRGIWLPERGYYPGLDQILRDAGIIYFVVDAHAIDDAKELPKYGTNDWIYRHLHAAADRM